MTADHELTLQFLRCFFDLGEKRVGAVIPRRSEPRPFSKKGLRFDLVAVVTNPVELLPLSGEAFVFTDVSVARETARALNENLGISLEVMKAVEFYFTGLQDHSAGLPVNDTAPLDVREASRAFDELDYEPTTHIMQRGFLRKLD